MLLAVKEDLYDEEKIAAIISIISSIVLLCMSISYIRQGFDKKDNYYNSELYPSINKNAYVGGDAYNYIINGTYFAGYCALGGSLMICSFVCGYAAVLLLSTDGTLATESKENEDIGDSAIS